jgi:hypothetical protein
VENHSHDEEMNKYLLLVHYPIIHSVEPPFLSMSSGSSISILITIHGHHFLQRQQISLTTMSHIVDQKIEGDSPVMEKEEVVELSVLEVFIGSVNVTNSITQYTDNQIILEIPISIFSSYSTGFYPITVRLKQIIENNGKCIQLSSTNAEKTIQVNNYIYWTKNSSHGSNNNISEGPEDYSKLLSLCNRSYQAYRESTCTTNIRQYFTHNKSKNKRKRTTANNRRYSHNSKRSTQESMEESNTQNEGEEDVIEVEAEEEGKELNQEQSQELPGYSVMENTAMEMDIVKYIEDDSTIQTQLTVKVVEDIIIEDALLMKKKQQLLLLQQELQRSEYQRKKNIVTWYQGKEGHLQQPIVDDDVDEDDQDPLSGVLLLSAENGMMKQQLTSNSTETTVSSTISSVTWFDTHCQHLEYLSSADLLSSSITHCYDGYHPHHDFELDDNDLQAILNKKQQFATDYLHQIYQLDTHSSSSSSSPNHHVSTLDSLLLPPQTEKQSELTSVQQSILRTTRSPYLTHLVLKHWKKQRAMELLEEQRAASSWSLPMIKWDYEQLDCLSYLTRESLLSEEREREMLQTSVSRRRTMTQQYYSQTQKQQQNQSTKFSIIRRNYLPQSSEENLEFLIEYNQWNLEQDQKTKTVASVRLDKTSKPRDDHSDDDETF